MRKHADRLNLRVKLEKRVQRLLQLGADFFFAAVDQMHGDVRGLAVLQLDLRLADAFNFVGGQQSHAVDQGEFRHDYCLTSTYVRSKSPCGAEILSACVSVLPSSDRENLLVSFTSVPPKLALLTTTSVLPSQLALL